MAYFSADLIPVVEAQRANYEHLVSTSKINFIGPLVLIIGLIVIIYGLLMLLLAARVEPIPGSDAAARPVALPST